MSLHIRVILTVTGGVLMYVIGERDYPWQMLADPDLISNLLLACASVWLFLAFTEWSVRIVDHLMPFTKQLQAYYRRRYTLQLLMSALPSLLLSMALSEGILRWIHGTSLSQTDYFKYEIYVVAICILCLQLILGMMHYTRTMKVERPKNHPQPRPHVQQQGLEGMDWEEIAYIFSKGKQVYIMDREGTRHFLHNMTIRKAHMSLPPDDFFLALRGLIVSRWTIVTVARLPGSRIALTLKPAYGQEVHLSRETSRAFKQWYGI